MGPEPYSRKSMEYISRRNGPDSFLQVTDSRQSVNENNVDVAKKSLKNCSDHPFSLASYACTSVLDKRLWAQAPQKEGRLPNMGGHIALPTTPHFLEVMNSLASSSWELVVEEVVEVQVGDEGSEDVI